MSGVLILMLLLILMSFLFLIGNFLNLLIILENLNVLLLFSCFNLWENSDFVYLFLVLLVLMTMEVSIGLVIVCSIWNLNSLNDIFIL
uniref:NADH dehydrogenase subunit 4L n=1 Tax=Polylabris halichoeres TaxID=1004784 RepID=G3F9Y7_POLHA|nr:NADH dehydrogenase subunit 4L [Polylabris halichoeres]AEB55009.1 NADH dehydrogenase subunit 4L [Polylabris halichoeres]